MESLPVEIIRHHIVTDFIDCAALRCTCARYRNFTIDMKVGWQTVDGETVDENLWWSSANTYLVVNNRVVCYKKVHSNPIMRLYLALTNMSGAEYIMWLCGTDYARVRREIVKIAAAGFTYHVAAGANMAVYIKTAELVARIYFPGPEYRDVIW